ncbi:uncharacterized protein CLAFUR5_09942 [Fulvia fulva]|uniref:BTB domain-containing protein n=1 Tax=Passalora fulva TaxID=5499 RepID=A0A9Q8URP1_PASFU|nr:uncharacterized protein CLAFUR5_09942 [Fulvia fulva]UJO19943.1 hypothetical protein CLAFUR5_09942 [Fulvia fulva]
MFSTTLALTTLTIHTALALSPSCAPGGNFDLTKRTLQLPTGTTNNPDQIPSSRLQGCNGYQDPGHNYFFTESGDGALVMKVPGDPPNTNCVTTSGSKHCRTECRESSPSSWSTTASKNRMYVDLIGVSGSQVCVGQAFQADSGYSKPVAEIYYYDNGDIKVGVEKVKAGGSQMLYQVGNVQQGKRWRTSATMATDQEEIASDGDVILVVGEETTRLRVSSMMLSAASPVFKALLGPHFREGQQARSAADPVEIALPNNASEPVTWVCLLLHHKVALELEANKVTEKLFDFAVTVDKYDCSEALRLQSRALLSQHAEDRPKRLRSDAADVRIIETAYLLRDAKCFKQQTGRLITHLRGNSSMPQAIRRYIHMLPESVLAAIEWKRNAAVNSFLEDCMSIAQCYYDNAQYDYNGFQTDVSQAIDAKRYWPPFTQRSSTASLKKAVKVLRGFGVYYKTCGECASVQDYRSKLEFEDLSLVADRVEEDCEGLCLACVLSEDADLKVACTKHT